MVSGRVGPARSLNEPKGLVAGIRLLCTVLAHALLDRPPVDRGVVALVPMGDQRDTLLGEVHQVVAVLLKFGARAVVEGALSLWKGEHNMWKRKCLR